MKRLLSLRHGGLSLLASAPQSPSRGIAALAVDLCAAAGAFSAALAPAPHAPHAPEAAAVLAADAAARAHVLWRRATALEVSSYLFCLFVCLIIISLSL